MFQILKTVWLLTVIPPIFSDHHIDGVQHDVESRRTVINNSIRVNGDAGPESENGFLVVDAPDPTNFVFTNLEVEAANANSNANSNTITRPRVQHSGYNQEIVPQNPAFSQPEGGPVFIPDNRESPVQPIIQDTTYGQSSYSQTQPEQAKKQRQRIRIIQQKWKSIPTKFTMHMNNRLSMANTVVRGHESLCDENEPIRLSVVLNTRTNSEAHFNQVLSYLGRVVAYLPRGSQIMIVQNGNTPVVFADFQDAREAVRSILWDVRNFVSLESGLEQVVDENNRYNNEMRRAVLIIVDYTPDESSAMLRQHVMQVTANMAMVGIAELYPINDRRFVEITGDYHRVLYIKRYILLNKLAYKTVPWLTDCICAAEEIVTPEPQAYQPLPVVTSESNPYQPPPVVTSEPNPYQPLPVVTSEPNPYQPLPVVTSEPNPYQPLPVVTSEPNPYQPLPVVTSEPNPYQPLPVVTSESNPYQPPPVVTSEPNPYQPLPVVTSEPQPNQPTEEDRYPNTIDSSEYCCYWAQLGECYTNSRFMKINCQKSCGTPHCQESNAGECVVDLNVANCPWIPDSEANPSPIRPENTGYEALASQETSAGPSDDSNGYGVAAKWGDQSQQNNVEPAFVEPTVNVAKTYGTSSWGSKIDQAVHQTSELGHENDVSTRERPDEEIVDEPETSSSDGRTSSFLDKYPNAVDANAFCCHWAQVDACNTNPTFMRVNCQKSCGTPECTTDRAADCRVDLNVDGCAWSPEENQSVQS